MVWSAQDFPYAWLWQEFNASLGFPWFGKGYVMAVEPNTSYPAVGIASVAERTGTQRTIDAGQTVDAELCVVLYRSNFGVRSISRGGAVDVFDGSGHGVRR